MGTGQASQWAAAVAAILMALAAVATPLLSRRTSRDSSTVDRARLEEEIRQNLLKGLAERVDALEKDVTGHEATIERLHNENIECLGDRAQLRNQLRDQDRKFFDQDRAIKTLTGDNARLAARVAELEKGHNESC